MVGSPNSLLSTLRLYIHLFLSFLESYIWNMFRGFRTAHFETQIWIIKLMELNTSTLGMWEALNASQGWTWTMWPWSNLSYIGGVPSRLKSWTLRLGS